VSLVLARREWTLTPGDSDVVLTASEQAMARYWCLIRLDMDRLA